MVDGRVFTFLNQSLDLGRSITWEPEGVDRLWHYQLHAFGHSLSLGCRFRDQARESDYRLFRDLVEKWIRACPIASAPAWDPYPTSLRIRNWLRAHALFAPALLGDTDFSRRFLDSIYSQARYLEHFVERHLLGNHLIENGRALLLAGAFFGDKRARLWRRKGERILWRELGRQFLADGGHDERSPMYHQLMLGVYQESVQTLEGLGERVPEGVQEQLDAMSRWLGALLHPDGQIPLFNDAVFSMTGPPAPLLTDAEPPSDGLTPLPETGYFAFRNGNAGDFAVFDCGPLGPDHQPGHGHCDCLSYEISVAGHRLIVDSGVGTYYGEQKWRDYYRSTRAHNTVQVDDEEQSEIWHRFRVARRAYPDRVQWGSGDGIDWAAGSHTGYRRLPGKVSHRRWFCWLDRRYWLICDLLTGSGLHRLKSFLHFHPDVDAPSPTLRGDVFAGKAVRDGTALRLFLWGGDSVSCSRGEEGELQGWYATEFNRQLANSVWTMHRDGKLPIWMAYLMSPDDEPVSTRFASTGGTRFQVQVQGDHESHSVVFDGENGGVICR
ncbi:MAG: heparinase II/III family protein [Acidobacteriota bacterium]|nr:heparinase II/III family protein [Acidobacteriota bacterium]